MNSFLKYIIYFILGLMIHFLLNDNNIEGFNDNSTSFYNLEIDGRIIKLNKQNSDLCFMNHSDPERAPRNSSRLDATGLNGFNKTRSTMDNFIHLVYREDGEYISSLKDSQGNFNQNGCARPGWTSGQPWDPPQFVYYSSDPPDTTDPDIEYAEGEKFYLFKMKKWTGNDGHPTFSGNEYDNLNVYYETPTETQQRDTTITIAQHDGGPSIGITNSPDNYRYMEILHNDDMRAYRVRNGHRDIAMKQPIESFYNYVYQFKLTSYIERERLGLDEEWFNNTHTEEPTEFQLKHSIYNFRNVPLSNLIIYNYYKLVDNLRRNCTPYILMKIDATLKSVVDIYASYDNLKTFYLLNDASNNQGELSILLNSEYTPIDKAPIKITDPSIPIFKNPFILLTRIIGKNPEGDERTDYIGCQNYECKTDKEPLVSKNYDPSNLDYLTCNNSLDFSPNKSLGTPCSDSICCFNTRCSGEDVCNLPGNDCSAANESNTLKLDASCMSIENCTNNFPLYCTKTDTNDSRTEFDRIDADSSGSIEYSELIQEYHDAELKKILGLRGEPPTDYSLTRQEFDEFIKE